MNIVYDVIVVGSGASGAMAAQTLVEGGRSILVLDGGRRDERYASLVPDESFVRIRRTDPSQFRYFLGDQFESLAPACSKTGAQLTPPRRFLVRDVDRYLKVRSTQFSPLESLAVGGLAGGWGLGCAVFSPEELNSASLPIAAMQDAYQVVASRIGLSGADDDARPYTSAHIQGVQPALPIDPTANTLLRKYERKREVVRALGFRVGRPALALLSEAKDGRRASLMHDMEFYSDHGGSAWRAWMTIDALRRHENFAYRDETLVVQFEERDAMVRVVTLSLRTNERSEVWCRRLVLASGALGTARIVLRSQDGPRARLPLLSNPYTYLPCIVPSRLGRAMPERNIALCQLALFHDSDGKHSDVAMGFVYSYRSLMMFRLLGDVPLSIREAPSFLRYLMSAFLIVGVHHPHANNGGSYVSLEPDEGTPTGDRLFIEYTLTRDERRKVDGRDRAFASCLQALGAVPVKRVLPGYGASIHYAGTVPCANTEAPMTTASDGRLHTTERVYIADGSSFTFLPAKGLTLSLMARGHVVASTVLSL